MLRADVEEDREATMARFLNGLKPEIADEVEMHHYVELRDMYEKALKIERRLKRRGSSRAPATPTSSYSRNNMPRREFKPMSTPTPAPRPRFEAKSEPPKGDTKLAPKAASAPPKPRYRDTKCWRYQGLGHIARQCPN